MYWFNKDGYREPLWYNQNTKRYINVRYAHKTTDWAKVETDNGLSKIHTYKYIKAVNCTPENFIHRDDMSPAEAREAFKKNPNHTDSYHPIVHEWDGWSMMCYPTDVPSNLTNTL